MLVKKKKCEAHFIGWLWMLAESAWKSMNIASFVTGSWNYFNFDEKSFKITGML